MNNLRFTAIHIAKSLEKSIPDSILNTIQEQWKKYNDTQKNILNHLFYNHQATVEVLTKETGVNERTVRRNLNLLVSQNILDRKSSKQRDKNANYIFKKL